MDGGGAGTVSYCQTYQQAFDPEDGHIVRYSNATLVWCPVCLAHGERKLHLVTETWQPGFEQANAAGETATQATVGRV